MTRILITGAAGFLGTRLVKQLLTKGELNGNPISEIILADLKFNEPLPPSPIKLTRCEGDLSAQHFVSSLIAHQADSIFHLASMLTLQAEEDPAHAYKVNVEALRQIVDGARNCPRVLFASSIAIHGGDLPETVEDGLNPIPATTYGTHKAINELLLADYSRLGRIDGRSLRLPIVVTRPGAAIPAISDKVAAIIRAPLSGMDLVIPFAPETLLPLASAGTVVDAFLALHEAPSSSLPPKRALNLPALTLAVSELVEALSAYQPTGQISFAPDPQVQKIVAGWPRYFTSNYAYNLGLKTDKDANALIKDYLLQQDENHD